MPVVPTETPTLFSLIIPCVYLHCYYHSLLLSLLLSESIINHQSIERKNLKKIIFQPEAKIIYAGVRTWSLTGKIKEKWLLQIRRKKIYALPQIVELKLAISSTDVQFFHCIFFTVEFFLRQPGRKREKSVISFGGGGPPAGGGSKMKSHRWIKHI